MGVEGVDWETIELEMTLRLVPEYGRRRQVYELWRRYADRLSGPFSPDQTLSMRSLVSPTVEGWNEFSG